MNLELMSKTEFTFIPRKLAKKAARSSEDTASTAARQQRVQNLQNDNGIPTSTSLRNSTNEKYLDDSTYRSLLKLALSDYALWSNTELLETMEVNEDGFIPSSYLTRCSPVFAGLSPLPPESVLVRCVRSSDTLEGRLIVADPSSSAWNAGKRKHEHGGTEGGYEVRRKDWMKVKDRIRKYTSFHWEGRTIYVENLPYYVRTYHTVYDFILQLLQGRSEKEQDPLPIQNISFPSHHKDPPGAPPPSNSKGFTSVVLSHTKYVIYLLERWPWDFDDQPKGSGDDSENMNKAVQEAREYGLHCLSKRKWDELKEQYLLLRRQLLEKVTSPNDAGPSRSKPLQSNGKLMPTGDVETSNEQEDPAPHSKAAVAWFPRDCLIFVKNTHPETNKTTLRTLFSSAFDRDASPIDYVDYNKGLDSCHLRLSSPRHAQTLIAHFSERKVMQTNALDNAGGPASGAVPIEVELVQGRKEEVYWEKVPEKIRQAALRKTPEEQEKLPPPADEGEEGKATGKKRKRQKYD